jgi:hypothetical protein
MRRGLLKYKEIARAERCLKEKLTSINDIKTVLVKKHGATIGSLEL